MDASYNAIDKMSKSDIKRIMYEREMKAIHHELSNNHMDERDNHTTDINRLVGGYSWEQFLDDTDNAVSTAGRIGHSFLGLGRMEGGRTFTENKAITKEPTQSTTIQHLRDKKEDIYSPDGVLISHYTPPEEMRDQSIRPDMPLDETEVVKPKPHLTQWQAFKKGISIIPHLIGALAGGQQPEPKKRGDKKPPNKWIQHIKQYAAKHNMSYRDALRDPKCKASYK